MIPQPPRRTAPKQEAEAAGDNEPLEPELLSAIEESDAQIARSEIVPWDVVRENMRRLRRGG